MEKAKYQPNTEKGNLATRSNTEFKMPPSSLKKSSEEYSHDKIKKQPVSKERSQGYT